MLGRMWPALIVGTAGLFLMTGYELVRSPSTTLLQAAYGTSSLAAIQAVSPFGTLAMIAGYGFLLGRLGARRTLLATSLLSAAALAGLGLAVRSGSAASTALLYAFREGYIVLLVEQYWALLNSVQDEESARKWNGWVSGLGSAGSFLGGSCVALASERLGTGALPLLAAATLLPAMLVSDAAHARYGGSVRLKAEPGHGGAAGLFGLSSLREHPVLVLIVVLVFASQAVAIALGLAFQERLFLEIGELDRRTAFAGRFYSAVAAFAALMQFVGTPLILRSASTRSILLAVPAIHLAGAAALAFWPTLPAAAGALLLFKGLDYSVFRVAKETLYIPLSFDARYRAKETIDAFGYRLSGGLTSLLAFGLHRLTGAGAGLYALLSAGAAAAWLGAVAARTVPARAAINGARPGAA